MNISLSHLEWLQVKADDAYSYGYHQEWYGTDWQRLAGCGPTTATQVLNYVSFRDGYLDPSVYRRKEDVLEMMEFVWPYIKPRQGGGLYKTRWMAEGINRFVKERSLPYEAKMLRIYPFHIMRPSLKEVVTFIEQALREDCPVAFLNRHKGREEGLDTWHWVPIVSMEQEGAQYIGSVYDDSKIRKFSINNWLQDTLIGGGFVYVTGKA